MNGELGDGVRPSFGVATALVVEVDRDGKVAWCNDACSNALGADARCACDRALSDVLGAADDPVRITDEIAHAARSGEPVTFATHPYRSGSVVQWTAVPVRGRDGNVVRVLVTGIDPPAASDDARLWRRVAERARVEHDELLALVVDAVLGVDTHGSIVAYNRAAERIFGWTAAEALGRSIGLVLRERRNDDDHDAGPRVLCLGARSDGAETVFTGIRRSGEEFAAEGAVRERDDGSLLVLVRDVTERNGAEEDFQLLTDVGDVLASTLDYERTLTNVANLSVRRLADWCCVDVLEAGVPRRLRVVHRGGASGDGTVLATLSLDRIRPGASDVLRRNEPVVIERIDDDHLVAAADDDDGLRALRELGLTSLVAAPLFARGELVGALVFLAATEGRHYRPRDVAVAQELARRAAYAVDNAGLYRSKKEAVRARDEVLGVVAHDLMNPLAAIRLTAKMLARASTDVDTTECVDAILRAADRGTRLIQDLLDVSRIEAGRLALDRRPVEVAELVRDAVESQRRLAAFNSIALAARVEEGTPPAVWADRDRILQVLENLLGNALKFTPEGGTVSIVAHPSGEDVEIRVSDTGRGIDASALPHVFDRFWQSAKSDRRSAGLGLAICKGIVEAHGGKIGAVSARGAGSTFAFTLPTQRGRGSGPPSSSS